MLELLNDLPDRVVCVKAIGEVTAQDYQDTLVPAVEERLARHRRVRLLYVLGEAFTGFTGAAAWEDAKIGMRHFASFERVAREVDPIIDRVGGLAGLVVVAEEFPGWDDFAAFTAHFRFVREHHRSIRRVARVTSSRFLSALPGLAGLFVDAEVKQFPLEQRAEAMTWAAGESG